jgi:hypothetical protein
MNTSPRGYEWVLWNLAVLGFWAMLILQLRDRWPMLILLLPLQVGVNLFAARVRNLSTTAYWAFLFSLGFGFCWICYLHFGVWWLCLLGLIPLGRVAWGVFSSSTEPINEEDRKWN